MMLERARELLQTSFQLCILAHPKNNTEHLDDNGSLNSALIVHSPTNSELGCDDYRRPISPTTGGIESPAQAEDRGVLPPNGIHYHFKTFPRTRVRLFMEKHAAKTTSWLLYREEKRKARSQAELERLKSMLQAEMATCGDRNIISQKYGDICKVIGRGSSAVTLLSHKKQECHPSVHSFYAIKVFRHQPGIGEDAFRKLIDAEFTISSSLRHRNVVRTLELIRVSDDVFCECLEYCPGGDLHSLVTERGRLETEEADCLLKQLMRGVNYLHQMGIAHRDLKPENLLLTLDGGLKISDFGTAEFFRLAWDSDVHMSTSRRGSRPYVSPEQYLNENFDPRLADVWAAAVTYIAMRTGRILWKVATPEDENFRDYVTDRQIGKVYFLIDDACTPASRCVISSMLDTYCTHRPTSSEVLHSSWLQRIQVCTDPKS